MTLCGVTLPFPRGLASPSDADVGMHAATDAIFGALAEGDIGRWFPPTDPALEGRRLGIFLRKAVERAAERGFSLTHLDVTLVCEAPKIGPHAEAMRAALAAIADSRSAGQRQGDHVRAAGLSGARRGIAAFATATLVQP